MDNQAPRRLAPTTDTVRRLYLFSGNQCAFPGCEHPIILADGTYVGELCHITAAERGGERFDPALTNEERRAAENLLLLCHDHHVITNNEAEFPVARLREMKRDHEARFERGLASMLASSGISIVSSTISLGGLGGTEPGAGGGGGGAIGPNARGGDGGAGGAYRAAHLDVVDVVDLRVRVGQPGSAGTAGTPAGSGGDTVVEAVSRDGTTKEVYRAAGGRSADSLRGEVRVTDAILADSVGLYGGLVSMLGAGWSSYHVAQSPFVLRFGIACLVAAAADSVGRLFVSVRDPSGCERAGLQQDFDLASGPAPFAANLMIAANELGDWSVVFSSGQGEIARRTFRVLLSDSQGMNPG